MTQYDVGVLFGGPAPEHDISILTGLQAIRALARGGSRVTAIYWSKAGEFLRLPTGLEAVDFVSGVPSGGEPLSLVIGPSGGFTASQGGFRPKTVRVKLDAVVNCCHGGPGEDGSLQGALDLAGVPYTGPSVATAGLGMDKLAFAAAADLARLPTLPRRGSVEAVDFGGPYIVKPRFGGSSIGIEVVQDLENAARRIQGSVHLRSGAVIEPYRPELFDLQVALRSYPELTLSAIERPLRKGSGSAILSYKDKYQPGGGMATAPRELPAQIKPEMAASIRSISEATAALVGARGVMRVDFLASEEGELYLNEVNTIPGSLSHYLFVDPRESFEDQLARDIAEAIQRPTYRPVTAGADGSVLSSASAIAAKLA